MNSSVTIGEINIICTDLDRSVSFYRDVLGFEVLEQEDVACHMRCGQTRFLLLAIAQSKPPRRPYGQTPEFSIDLMVDDLAEVVGYLQVHQVEFVSEWAANKNEPLFVIPMAWCLKSFRADRQYEHKIGINTVAAQYPTQGVLPLVIERSRCV